MELVLRPITIISLAGFLLVSIYLPAEEIYGIDPAHADFSFSVTHLVINKVKGKFTKFDGFLVLDDKGRLINAEATIKTASIDTEIASRDDHLRSSDFFDVDTYPDMKFKATKVRRRFGKDLLIGEFTIKNVTKRLALPFELKGPVIDPWGNKRIGFEARAKINRLDYGLTWNQVLETGGVMVGEEVEIFINIEGLLIEE